MVSQKILFRFILSLCLLSLIAGSALAQYTIYNGHMDGNIAGWDGTLVDGRENGGFNGTTAYQAINSSFDTSYPGSGSVLFTATAGNCSLTQELNINTEGQTLSVSADIAWDGTWTNFFFGFYEGDPTWNRLEDCSFEITTDDVPADTDGTLDSFTRVTIRNVTLGTNGLKARIFFGTSCTPNYTGAVIGTSIAVDNVTPDYDPSAVLLNRGVGVADWYLY